MSLKRPLRPRVAIIGPKGSGKTIYRQYLATGQARVPPYLCNALRVREVSWGAHAALVRQMNAGVENPADPASWPWREDKEDVAPIEHRGDVFLRKVRGTNHLTLHPLSFPSVHASADTEADLLDFPGEHLAPLRERAQLDTFGLSGEQYQSFVKADLALIAQCRVVILTLPFWLVLPQGWRNEVTPLDRALAESRARDRGAASVEEELARICEERHNRENDLFRSASDWLSRLQSIVASPAKPMLLVVFTMLDSNWEHELRPAGPAMAPDAERVRELLRKARALVASDRANGRLRGFRAPAAAGFLQRWARAWHDLARSAEMKVLLEELHSTLDEYVELARAHWKAGASGDNALGHLAHVLEGAGTHRVRYMAMNIVSEHSRLRISQLVEDDYPLQLNPAGALLPMVYLCGNLEELAS